MAGKPALKSGKSDSGAPALYIARWSAGDQAQLKRLSQRAQRSFPTPAAAVIVIDQNSRMQVAASGHKTTCDQLVGRIANQLVRKEPLKFRLLRWLRRRPRQA